MLRSGGCFRKAAPAASEDPMKAIVQDRYGSADVLELKDIDQPEVGDDDVLVRVLAASAHIGDWHFMTGLPYLFRIAGSGLRAPKARVRGTDCRRPCRGGRKGCHAVSAGR